MWTPTPPLFWVGGCHAQVPHACVCVPLLAGLGGPASSAHFGAPHLFSFLVPVRSLFAWPPPGWGCPVCRCCCVFGSLFFSLFVRHRCTWRSVFSPPVCPGPWRLVVPPPSTFPLRRPAFSFLLFCPPPSLFFFLLPASPLFFFSFFCSTHLFFFCAVPVRCGGGLFVLGCWVCWCVLMWRCVRAGAGLHLLCVVRYSVDVPVLRVLLPVVLPVSGGAMLAALPCTACGALIACSVLWSCPAALAACPCPLVLWRGCPVAPGLVVLFRLVLVCVVLVSLVWCFAPLWVPCGVVCPPPCPPPVLCAVFLVVYWVCAGCAAPPAVLCVVLRHVVWCCGLWCFMCVAWCCVACLCWPRSLRLAVRRAVVLGLVVLFLLFSAVACCCVLCWLLFFCVVPCLSVLLQAVSVCVVLCRGASCCLAGPVVLRSCAGFCCAVPFGALLCRGASLGSVLCCWFHCGAGVASCLVRCCGGLLCPVCPSAWCCVVLLCCLWSSCCCSLCRVSGQLSFRSASCLVPRRRACVVALRTVLSRPPGAGWCYVLLPVVFGCLLLGPAVLSCLLAATGVVFRWCCSFLPTWLAARWCGVGCLWGPTPCVEFCGGVLLCGGVLSCPVVCSGRCRYLLFVSCRCAFWGVVLPGVVLCVPCLRSLRCCAALCWCPCVVLFVWSALFLAPGAVMRCCVLCCFLWCASLRFWPWLPAVFVWWRVSVSVSLCGRVAGFPVVGQLAAAPCSAVLCPVVLCCCVVLCCPVLVPFCGAVCACSALFGLWVSYAH